MTVSPRPIIGVIGAGQATPEGYADALEVGRRIAEGGAVLVCGGLGGIMEAACRGAREAGGETLGILPGADRSLANPWVSLPVPTHMGHARNVIIAHTAAVLIAIEGEYGTISEMAIALKLGKPVLTLRQRLQIPGARVAGSPQEAVRQAFEAIASSVLNEI